MKNYEEMFKDVLDRIDEYEAEKKMKRVRMTKIAASVTPVCAVAVVGVCLWKSGVLNPDHNQLIASNIETTVSDIEQITTDYNDGINNAITNTTPSEQIDGTLKGTEANNSDTSMVVTPETKTSEDEDVISEITEKPQTNEEVDNSNGNPPMVSPEVEIPHTESTLPEVEIQQTEPENILESYYAYNVNSGDFSTYVAGKVISESKIGGKINNVSVTAGWKNRIGEWISTESLNAEIYEIEDVSSDVAVALKFLDKGEALTTTHYYVIMNPNADLTPVTEYMIAPVTQNNSGEEMANEQENIIEDIVETSTAETTSTEASSTEEAVLEKRYVYSVDNSKFSTYIAGKVISENKVGDMIEHVSVKAGWENHIGELLSTESLNAEIYEIKDVSSDVAVVLKFLDKGEALTTTHYYVIMNPNADLTPIMEYTILPLTHNNSGEEIGIEILE